MLTAIRPDAIWVWADRDVADRLAWYREVMLDRKPAKFQIARRIPLEKPPEGCTEEELWGLHEQASAAFRQAWREVREDRLALEDLEIPASSFLDAKIALARSMLRHCNFCEWRCEVDRTAARWGVCRVTDVPRVNSAFPHFGEEPPLIGPDQGGSGTIFFAGCVFHCVFCQNYDISQDARAGTPVTPADLAAIIDRLRNRGAANVNFVGGEPTPSLHTILEALRHARTSPPTVWNSDMYCTREAMQLLDEVVDLWLPDFKFGNDECARRLSRVRNYMAVVSRNHAAAHARGDMIVRHLVMPNHLDCCTEPVLRWVAENLPRALVNVMDQYRPAYLAETHPDRFEDISRRPRGEEIERAFRLADRLGLAWREVSR